MTMVVISSFVAALFVGLIFAGFRYLAQRKVAALYGQYDFEQLRKRFGSLAVIDSVLAVILVIGGMLGGGYLGGGLVYEYLKRYVWTTSDTRLLLELPTWVILYVGAGTFTPLALAVIYLLGWWALLGQNAKEYYSYTSMKNRMVYPLWSIVLHFVVVPAGVAYLFLLACDNYVRATNDELVINRYWTFGEERYRYDEITSIQYRCDFIQRENQLQPVPNYRLTFVDGGEWESQGMFKEEGPYPVRKTREFFGFVSQQSGKPIVEVPSATHP